MLWSAPGAPGDQAVLQPSLSAPACGVFVMDPMNGWQCDFSVDGLSLGVLGLTPFWSGVDASGTATWIGFPNYAQLLGVTLYWTAIDLGDFSALRGVTDTLTMN